MRVPSQLPRQLVVAVALLAAGFFAAYLRFLPHLERSAEYTDGERTHALDDERALRFALWDAPVDLGAPLNTPDDEGRPALSPDGRWLVFTVGEAQLGADLWIAEMVGGHPTSPRPLQRLCTGYAELAPAFTDGALLFASDRPGGAGGLDVWLAPFAEGEVGAARVLGASVNGPWDDTDPAAVAGSDAIVFASDRPRGRRTDFDLYLAVPRAADDWTSVLRDATAARAVDTSAVGGEDEPSAGDVDASTDPDATSLTAAFAVVPLDALNTAFDEREPAFTADARDLFFASDRAGGEGGFDLLRSLRSHATFLPPVALAGVNSSRDERGPAPSRDGFTLLLARDVPSPDATQPARLDLLRAVSRELLRVPGRPVGWLDLTILGLLLLFALLTWLGRRWETLDILAKCLLVSLLVHLMLLLWFREVPVEQQLVELPKPGPTFRVQLAPSEHQVEATRERAGELEGRPATPLAGASAPDRRANTQEAALAAASGEARPAAAEALPAPELAAAEAPGARATDADRPRKPSDAAAREVALADAPTSHALHAGNAPSLGIVALASDVSRSATRDGARPTRVVTGGGVAGAADETISAAASPVPASTNLAVPRVARGPDAPAPERFVERPDGAVRAGSAVPELRDAPRPLAEAGRSGGADAPALDLSSLAGATSDALADARSARGLARPGRHAADDATSMLADEGARPSASPSELALPAMSLAEGSTADSVLLVDLRPGAREALPALALHDAASAGAASTRAARDGGTTSPDSSTSTRPDAAREDDGPTAFDALVGAVAATSVTSSSARGRRAGPQRPLRAGVLAAPAAADARAVRPAPTALLALPATERVEPSPATSEDTRWDHTPYRTRFGQAKTLALDEHGGSQKTEEAVARGLAYLARLQAQGGNWGDADDFDDKYGHVAVGKTALCLLAFLGAGHTPSAGEYAKTTKKAVDFLLAVQDGETGHFGFSSSYSHGVTTYALAECLALTGDERLRAPLRRAVDWIVANQNTSRDPRRRGGWGYYYPDGRGYDGWPRSSITAWQVMALESARLAGIDVPDAAFDGARGFLRNAHREERGVILYSHEPARLNGPYWTLPGSTPAGLFALSLLGEPLDDPSWASCIAWISERAPDGYERPSNDAFVLRAESNLYFWYYGSLVLFRHGGAPWDAWNRALQDTLLPSQQRDGSWESLTLYADYAGDDRNDHAYATAMCVLTLEVYYRYFTPLLLVK